MSTPCTCLELMNWEDGLRRAIGSGARPWETMRVLPGSNRRPSSCATGRRRDGRRDPHLAPNDAPNARRSGPRASATPLRRARNSSSTSPATPFEDMAEKGYNDIERVGYYNEDYHLLQADQAGASVPPDPQPDDRGPDPNRRSARARRLRASTRSTSATTRSWSRPTGGVLFKHGAKEIAWLNGYGLTFMAKPYADWTGSSGHLHISLWDKKTDEPLFFDPASKAPYGMGIRCAGSSAA